MIPSTRCSKVYRSFEAKAIYDTKDQSFVRYEIAYDGEEYIWAIDGPF